MVQSGVSAKQSGSSRFTQPRSSSSSFGPLPQPSPRFWLIHWRESRKTSTNGSSVFQSAGPARLMPNAGRGAGAVEAGRTATSSTRRKGRKRAFMGNVPRI
jgi:hypothetical protein